jgi:hypothetical protein
MGTIDANEHLIRASIVARYKAYLYPLSSRAVSRMCENRIFKTAVKLGPGKNSPWYVCPAEVLAYKARRYATAMNKN